MDTIAEGKEFHEAQPVKKKKQKIDHKNLVTRKARLSDLSQLVSLEEASFNYDQLSRRNFQWMIKHAHSVFLVQEFKGVIIGYGLVLINAGTSLARLYSICTHKDFQGQGLASLLITELEQRASDEEDCAYLRLEVKENNKAAIALYRKLGYRKFTVKKDYYDDGKAAWCFEKRIKTLKVKPRLKVPYYQQGTDFTCGPASLMMAMKTFDRKQEMTLIQELDLWREATTIFMTSGHGGCGPHGLALAAHNRGYKPELYLFHVDTLFVDTVRSQEKKKIIELVNQSWELRIEKKKIPVHRKKLTLQDIKDILKSGGIPIVLISTYHFDFHRVPHWVVITAYDDHFVYIHDPDQTEPDNHEGHISRVHIPIPEDQFLKISRWGKDKVSAAVVIYK